ncbi:hypothetical protein K3495_g5998 [Podosphaera aphanis]|nr:hypothetical protein K3495_g5998 [Podosphaera aphanis]
MSIANYLNPIKEDQGAIEELHDNQIIEMVPLPEEEEQEELAEEKPQVSRTEKLKSLGIVISLLDISKEKDLEVYRHPKRIQNEIRYSSGTQNTLDRWLFFYSFLCMQPSGYDTNDPGAVHGAMFQHDIRGTHTEHHLKT